jgi:predicted nuclease with RNAse H fold
MMGITAACIDITGSRRAMDVAFLEDDALDMRAASNLKTFLDWVGELKPDVIAVDAPSKENVGLVARHRDEFDIPDGSYENFRIAEALLKLKGIGLYNTPQTNPPEWMKRGWDLYSLLQGKGYFLLDTPGPVKSTAKGVFEVHPHASFVVGLGWIPQSKQTLAGQFERLAYLRRECRDLGISIGKTMLTEDQLGQLKETTATWETIVVDGLTLPEISHDQLDAIAGLTTAIRAIRGDGVAIGHQGDGVIVVPRKLSETPYQWKHK